MQPEIILYTKDYCPYCQRAKALLKSKGVGFTEYEVADNPARFAEMIQRSHGGRTVPQIFIGETHVGGATDLFALNDAGKLDTLLRLTESA